MPQHTGDYVLTFTGGKFQNSHVQAVGDLLTVSVPQCVVSDAEHTRREHFFAILVVGKGSGLSRQRINNVPVINRYLLFTDQPWHRLNMVSLVSHRDLLGSNSHIHLLAY